VEESGFWNYEDWGEPTRSASRASEIIIDLDVAELVGLELGYAGVVREDVIGGARGVIEETVEETGPDGTAKEYYNLWGDDWGAVGTPSTTQSKPSLRQRRNMERRPPTISIMGHVDHGKTSLLDRIRLIAEKQRGTPSVTDRPVAAKKSSKKKKKKGKDSSFGGDGGGGGGGSGTTISAVAGNEAGGITQMVTSFSVDVGENKVTFVDTPGHALYDGMRSVAVSTPNILIGDECDDAEDSDDTLIDSNKNPLLTDIVVLIVAGDDGVRGTTKEVLDLLGYSTENDESETKVRSNVKLIVAVTKLDLPTVADNQDAAVNRVRNELSAFGVDCLEGGEVPVFGVRGLGDLNDEETDNFSVQNVLKRVKQDDPTGVFPLLDGLNELWEERMELLELENEMVELESVEDSGSGGPESLGSGGSSGGYGIIIDSTSASSDKSLTGLGSVIPSLVWREGTLRRGDVVVFRGTNNNNKRLWGYGKVKSLIDYETKRNLGESISASTPSLVGLTVVDSGDAKTTDGLVGGGIVTVVDSERVAKDVVEEFGSLDAFKNYDDSNLTAEEREIRKMRKEEEREIVFHGGASRLKDRILKKRKEVLGDLESKIKYKNYRAPLILKCDIAGQLEALEKALKELGGDVSELLKKHMRAASGMGGGREVYNHKKADEEVQVFHNLEIDIIGSSLGQITNSEAVKAAESNAVIVCFGSAHTAGKVTPGEARKTVKNRDVKIIKSDVIYSLLEDIKVKIGEEYLPKVRAEKIVGKGKLQKVFTINAGKSIEEDLVAGCKINTGKFVVNYNAKDKSDDSVAKYRVIRDGKVVADNLYGVSLRRFKDKVSEVESEGSGSGNKKGPDGECGLTMGGWNMEGSEDLNMETLLKDGDLIECYMNVETGVKLD